MKKLQLLWRNWIGRLKLMANKMKYELKYDCKSYSQEERYKYANEMVKLYPQYLDPSYPGSHYMDGKLERVQDIKACGDIRATDRWIANHYALHNWKVNEGKAERNESPYTELHQNFVEEVKAFCENRNIDVYFSSAPASLYIPKDCREKYTLCMMSHKFEIDQSLPLANQGRILAYKVMDDLISKPNANVLALYMIEKRDTKTFNVRYSIMNTEDPAGVC